MTDTKLTAKTEIRKIGLDSATLAQEASDETTMGEVDREYVALLDAMNELEGFTQSMLADLSEDDSSKSK
jgi:hypothetical protein